MPTSRETTSIFDTVIDPSHNNVVASTQDLRMRGSGCLNPAMGCNRTAYTVSAGKGYLRNGYDTGRWWVK